MRTTMTRPSSLKVIWYEPDDPGDGVTEYDSIQVTNGLPFKKTTPTTSFSFD